MNPPAPTPVQPTAIPGGQINPAIQRLLQQRALMAMRGAPGVAGAPNSMGLPGAIPVPGVGNARVMAGRPGAANPAQAVTKAAQAAQSPLVADTGTRALAKALIQKLMQHM
jgi:hypothetical protein